MPNHSHQRPPLFTSLQYLVIGVATISGMALGGALFGGHGALIGFFAGALTGVVVAVSFFF
jgi:hypothetical protein